MKNLGENWYKTFLNSLHLCSNVDTCTLRINCYLNIGAKLLTILAYACHRHTTSWYKHIISHKGACCSGDGIEPYDITCLSFTHMWLALCNCSVSIGPGSGLMRNMQKPTKPTNGQKWRVLLIFASPDYKKLKVRYKDNPTNHPKTIVHVRIVQVSWHVRNCVLIWLLFPCTTSTYIHRIWIMSPQTLGKIGPVLWFKNPQKRMYVIWISRSNKFVLVWRCLTSTLI